MTAQDFSDVLDRGKYESGKPYGPNKDGVVGWCGSVRIGDEYFQYTVHDRTSPVEPAEVVKAIKSATRINQRDNGKRFDATVWSGGSCYMLWHQRSRKVG